MVSSCIRLRSTFGKTTYDKQSILLSGNNHSSQCTTREHVLHNGFVFNVHASTVSCKTCKARLEMHRICSRSSCQATTTAQSVYYEKEHYSQWFVLNVHVSTVSYKTCKERLEIYGERRGMIFDIQALVNSPSRCASIKIICCPRFQLPLQKKKKRKIIKKSTCKCRHVCDRKTPYMV